MQGEVQTVLAKIAPRAEVLLEVGVESTGFVVDLVVTTSLVIIVSGDSVRKLSRGAVHRR